MERKEYSDIDEICDWLDCNSAGSYYPSAIAAKLIRALVIEVDELQVDSDFLQCLRGAGVDNWDGYDDAREMMGMED